jgi:A/G-specific adenine glycosylase
MQRGHQKNIPAKHAQIFRVNLLAWYDAHARDLPWRRNRDPYRVWVSEIMLQQTRVAAVINHYHEFLRRFPTVEKLASARQSSVLAAWSGLGYYRRARMLHAAAKVIVREWHGKFPETADGWRKLPGVGRYTAAAIASIACNVPIAVVDGNVERVLARACGRRLSGQQLWHAAEDLLDRQRPGDFNQAMMELGATVCMPKAPACLLCPIVELCATRGDLPSETKAPPQKRREIHYALDHHSDNGRHARVFLLQRPRHASMMAGMWELPEIPSPGHLAKPLFKVKHSITVTDYTVSVWSMSPSNHSAGEWIAVPQLPKLAMTGLARKILRKAGIIKSAAVL